MINNDRIVPVTNIDLISLYGLIIKRYDSTTTKLDATTTNGQFEETRNNAKAICSEPVSTFNFDAGITAGTIYFVPAYNYAGFTINGAATATTGETVNADGKTLYRAVLSDTTITTSVVGF